MCKNSVISHAFLQGRLSLGKRKKENEIYVSRAFEGSAAVGPFRELKNNGSVFYNHLKSENAIARSFPRYTVSICIETIDSKKYIFTGVRTYLPAEPRFLPKALLGRHVFSSFLAVTE